VPRALISVYDKSGLEILLPCLSRFRYEIIASGGTAQRIQELGYRCTEISAFTGYPESPRGLVKTLHPRVHGGFLLDPSNPDDRQYMLVQGIAPIDLLVANLYPFETVVQEKTVTLKLAAENIDIGGPAMIRAAAKSALQTNRVSVLTNPKQYEDFTKEMEQNRGEISRKTKRKLTEEAFALTYRYDLAIQNYLSKTGDAQ
jgi:phosphoribosylaminoimidazolecarboxamide formyltransferase/IMP cyclohydrolase